MLIKDKSFEATGLGSKILSVVLSYPYLAREIEDLDKFSNFNEPEVRLMTEVVAFFINARRWIADLLSTLDKESASFVGALISINDQVEEQNARDYLNDLFNLRKSDSVTRI